MRRALAGIALLGFVGSCSCETEDPGALRPNVHVMLDLGETSTNGGDRIITPLVLDVSADGNRLYVLERTSDSAGATYDSGPTASFQETVFFSDDFGATWRSTPIKGDLGKFRPEGILASGGRIVMTFPGDREGAGGHSYFIMPIGDFDLATGAVDVDTQHSTRWLYDRSWAFGPSIVSFAFFNAPGMTEWDYDWYRYKLETDAIETRHHKIAEGQACAMKAWIALDADHFAGACSGPTSFATGRVQPEAAMSPRLATASRLLHPFLEKQAGVVNASIGPVTLFTGGGRTFAAWMDGGGLRYADLGLGKPVDDLWPGRLHSPFARFVVVVDEGQRSTRVLDVLADGSVAQLSIPGSPCAVERECGAASKLLWLQPLGGDEYLAFYSLELLDPEVGSHKQILVSREKATAAPAQIGGGPTPLSSPPGHEGALEIPRLIQLCYRAPGCLRTSNLQSKSWQECLDYWLTVRGGPPESDELFQGFAALSPASCEDYRLTWYEEWLRHWESCSPTCMPGSLGPNDFAVKQCTNVNGKLMPSRILNCAATGTTCAFIGGHPTCTDGTESCDLNVRAACNEKGNALTCSWTPLVEGCVPGSACQVAGGEALCSFGQCAGTAETECQGDMLVTCKAGQVVERRDCRRAEMTCGQPNGKPACVFPTHSGTCAAAPLCEGTVAYSCDAGGRERWLDCSAMAGICQYGVCHLGL